MLSMVFLEDGKEKLRGRHPRGGLWSRESDLGDCFGKSRLHLPRVASHDSGQGTYGCRGSFGCLGRRQAPTLPVERLDVVHNSRRAVEPEKGNQTQPLQLECASNLDLLHGIMDVKGSRHSEYSQACHWTGEQERSFCMKMLVNNACRRWHPPSIQTGISSKQTPPCCKMRGAQRSPLPVVVETGVSWRSCLHALRTDASLCSLKAGI